ncbi:unnamed protein product [Pieris macdunnoughi]|uniref:Uncharacterized protein n=1 Tax=Pieris macdunnoughi TaxID=345717 RepID=A0A821XZ95_9NEOP|nr:unnamed protein product [Pieris macdunnoughi]
MEESQENIQETEANFSRKRIPQTKKWKRNEKKVSRYSPKRPPNTKDTLKRGLRKKMSILTRGRKIFYQKPPTKLQALSSTACVS